jgi:hypothetical protein
MNRKKVLIIIGIILIVVGIIVLILSFKEDKEEEELIIDKDIILSNIKEEDYEEVEDNVYVLKSENDGIISAYILDFNKSTYQFYYNNKEFNAISEYNYLYNKSSYVFIRNNDRGTIHYDHKSKEIDCESNIINWCNDNKKDFLDKYSIYEEFVKLTK